MSDLSYFKGVLPDMSTKIRQFSEKPNSKVLHVTFGRMNPPTKAHITLIETMRKESNGHFRFFLSNKQDQNNPLSLLERIRVLIELHPPLAFHLAGSNDLFTAMDQADQYMSFHGYEEIVLWGGTDRIPALNRVLLYPDRWKFKVKDIREIVRTESNISATAVREAAVNRDIHTFNDMAAVKYESAAWLFETLHERLVNGSLESPTKTTKRRR